MVLLPAACIFSEDISIEELESIYSVRLGIPYVVNKTCENDKDTIHHLLYTALDTAVLMADERDANAIYVVGKEDFGCGDNLFLRLSIIPLYLSISKNLERRKTDMDPWVVPNIYSEKMSLDEILTHYSVNVGLPFTVRQSGLDRDMKAYYEVGKIATEQGGNTVYKLTECDLMYNGDPHLMLTVIPFLLTEKQSLG